MDLLTVTELATVTDCTYLLISPLDASGRGSLTACTMGFACPMFWNYLDVGNGGRALRAASAAAAAGAFGVAFAWNFTLSLRYFATTIARAIQQLSVRSRRW